MPNTHSLDLEASSSQYAYISDASQSGLDLSGSHSIEALIKLESTPASGGYMIIAGKGGGGGEAGNAYDFGIRNNAGTLKLWHQIGDGTDTVGTEVTWKPLLDTWYRVAVVYDSATPDVTFYVDGIQIGSAQSTSQTSVNNSATEFAIGRYGSGSLYFDGLVDDVRVWNDVRTLSEIQDNLGKELNGDEAGLVGYWKLNNDYTDETSNGNDLTASGSPVFSTDVWFTNFLIIISGTSDITDNFMDKGTPTSNNGSDTLLQIGESFGTGFIYRILLKVLLSDIPSDAVLSSVELQMRVINTNSNNGGTVEVFRSRRAWEEATSTWNLWKTSNSWSTAGAGDTTNDREGTNIGSVAVPASISSGYRYSISLDTDKITEMRDGDFTNNGFVMKTSSESGLDGHAPASSEYTTDPDYVPRLVVKYSISSAFKPKIIMF